MTAPSATTRRDIVRAALAAVLTLVGLFAVGVMSASAHTLPGAQTRVRVPTPISILAVGVSEHITAGQGRGPPVSRAGFVVATGVATETAGDVARSVPDPEPVYKPNGAPDRSSPWYVSYRDADGNLQTVGNLNGVHTEVRIQERMPGTPMSRPFGWRTLDPAKGPEWVEGTVCQSCQIFPPSLFPPGTRGAPGGPWGHG